MSYLTPTKHPRLNEAVGFLLFSLSLLLLISLVSYHPMDPSLNVSRDPLSSMPVHNWAGRFGASLADLLLTLLGFPAFAFPVFFAWAGWHWVRSRAIANPGTKLTGCLFLVVTTCSLLGLLLQSYLNWFNWSLRAGGLTGDLLSAWLRMKFNFLGSLLLLVTLFFVSLFVVTRFSFSAAIAWLRDRTSFFKRWREKWEEWQKQKEREQDRRELERKLRHEESGKKKDKPVIVQSISEIKEAAPPSARKVAREQSPADTEAAAGEPRISDKMVQIERAAKVATRKPPPRPLRPSLASRSTQYGGLSAGAITG